MIERERVEDMRAVVRTWDMNRGLPTIPPTTLDSVLTDWLAMRPIVEELAQRRMASQIIRFGEPLIVCDWCYQSSNVDWKRIEHTEQCVHSQARKLLGLPGDGGRR